MNYDSKKVIQKRLLQLSELDEIREMAYENSKIYKERTKKWHDAKVKIKNFQEGDQVLLFNSRLRLFLGKLKSRWSGLFVVSHVYPYGAMEVCNTQGEKFKVNGQRLKIYHEGIFENSCQLAFLVDLTP